MHDDVRNSIETVYRVLLSRFRIECGTHIDDAKTMAEMMSPMHLPGRIVQAIKLLEELWPEQTKAFLAKHGSELISPS